jgi:hypothetical protein
MAKSKRPHRRLLRVNPVIRAEPTPEERTLIVIPGPATMAVRPSVPIDVTVISMITSSPTYVLGVDPDSSAATKAVLRRYDAASTTQTWTLIPLVQSQYCYLLHRASGKYARFNGGKGAISVETINWGDSSFLISFEDERAGFTAVNNKDHDLVFVVQNNVVQDGQPIIANNFHGTDNEWWMFLPLLP